MLKFTNVIKHDRLLQINLDHYSDAHTEPTYALSAHSGFLSQSKDTHVSLADDSKLTACEREHE